MPTNPNEEAGVPFDFRRQEPVTKAQIDVICALHGRFVETLSSSLTFYLRSTVSGVLTRIDQVPFSDFVRGLPSPACVVNLTMQPYQGCALLEISHSLLEPVLDHVLGGNGTIKTNLNREITEVEATMLDTFFGIIAQGLTDAWRATAAVEFAVEGIERRPHLSDRIPQDEVVVAVRMELQVAGAGGMVNLAIPSGILQALGHRIDRQREVPRQGSEGMEEIAGRIAAHLSRRLHMDVELAILGASVNVADLVTMKAGDVLDLGVPDNGKATVLVNGYATFQGELVAVGDKRSVLVESVIRTNH